MAGEEQLEEAHRRFVRSLEAHHGAQLELGLLAIVGTEEESDATMPITEAISEVIKKDK